MADEAIALRVLKALTAALEEVTPSNGYTVDLQGRVFRGRNRFGPSDPVPMICVLEAPIPLEQIPPPTDSSESSGGWELVIQGFVKDDKANPTDPAHAALADVKRRLALERRKSLWDRPEQGMFGLGRFVHKMYIGRGVVRPPDEVSEKAYFWLQVTLDIVEDLADPYED
jgi:hypothetical protein